jgi:hypothetical protein
MPTELGIEDAPSERRAQVKAHSERSRLRDPGNRLRHNPRSDNF